MTGGTSVSRHVGGKKLLAPVSRNGPHILTLFQVHPYVPRLGVFDVTADGQKFLVFGDTGAASGTPLSVVMNWDADLQKK